MKSGGAWGIMKKSKSGVMDMPKKLECTYDRTVLFDNNQAEHNLRMIKVKTKISGYFRLFDGDGVFVTIKSYTFSLRKNGKTA
jgi:hypothetical protein